MIVKGENLLRDVPVLLVDDQPFRRDYVAHLLMASGGEMIGPFTDDQSVLAYLAAACSPPLLAYVACGIAGDAPHFVAQLAGLGVRCVAICSERSDWAFPAGTIVLSPPLAAFQVMEALVQLRRQCGQADVGP